MAYVDPLAAVYAGALAEALEARGGTALLAEGGERLAAVASAWKGDRRLRAFFLSADVPASAKASAMAKLAEGQPKLLGDFLKLLLRRGRLEVLDGIGDAFEAILDRRLGRVQVTLTTAAPVPEDMLRAWGDALRTSLGKEPIVRHVVRPDLVAGAVVRAGDVLMDGSARRRLARFERRIIERGTHAVQP